MANNNRISDRTIASLRLIQTRLKSELSRRKAWAETSSPEKQRDERANRAKRFKLLERIADSNGNPERTIAALRLSIETLERELERCQATPVTELVLTNLPGEAQAEVVEDEAGDGDSMALIPFAFNYQ
jgi:hypothetical protein